MRAILFVLFLLVVPAVAHADVVGAGTAAEEVVECTWPSSSLLSMDDTGSGGGFINAFISGVTVYLQSAGRYVSGKTAKWNETAIKYETPIFRLFNRLMAPKPRQAPPQQQQQPAQQQ